MRITMKKAVSTCLVAALALILGTGRGAAAEPPDATPADRGGQMMTEANDLLMAADKDFAGGNSDAAGRLYARAQRLFMSLAEDFPGRQADEVEKHILHCDDRIGAILNALMAAPPAPTETLRRKHVVIRRPDDAPAPPENPAAARMNPLKRMIKKIAPVIAAKPDDDPPVSDAGILPTPQPAPAAKTNRVASPEKTGSKTRVPRNPAKKATAIPTIVRARRPASAVTAKSPGRTNAVIALPSTQPDEPRHLTAVSTKTTPADAGVRSTLAPARRPKTVVAAKRPQKVAAAERRPPATNTAPAQVRAPAPALSPKPAKTESPPPARAAAPRPKPRRVIAKTREASPGPATVPAIQPVADKRPDPAARAGDPPPALPGKKVSDHDASASMNLEIVLLMDDMRALDAAEQELLSEAIIEAPPQKPAREKNGLFSAIRNLVPRVGTATPSTGKTVKEPEEVSRPKDITTIESVRLAAVQTRTDTTQASSEPKQARSELKTPKPVLSTEPKDELPSDIQEVAYVYLRGGAPERAQVLLYDGLSRAPQRHDLRLLLAMAKCQMREYKDAADLAKHVLRNDVGNARAHVVLGTAYLGMGDIDLAKDQMIYAIELDPDQREAHYNLAHLWVAIEPPDLATARGYYARAIELGAAQDPELERLLR